MLKRLCVILALFFASFAAIAKADVTNPYAQMQEAAKQLFSSFDAEKAEIARNPELLKTLVRKDLIPYIQVKYAGALILGSSYEKATKPERDAYFTAFENYLVQALAQALSLYDGQDYQIESAKDLTGKDIVSIRILLVSHDKNQQPIRLDFQWRKNTRSGEWKAYDMIAEGVSMVSTKQNEWATTLRQNGIAALTKQLQQAADQPIKLQTK
ncbi:phospholipid-binding protein MlaC [Utexia brackfieldae]|uniref:phospholipid-binding protein MlaC n=1 Tax=Utexia brackfieldae TaxID=3074108 RepID=UPI00370DD50E